MIGFSPSNLISVSFIMGGLRVEYLFGSNPYMHTFSHMHASLEQIGSNTNRQGWRSSKNRIRSAKIALITGRLGGSASTMPSIA
jgi:hypothetical protein